MPSEKASSPSPTPVWSTGAEQVEVEVVVTGEMYSVDKDIAKRMGIVQGTFSIAFAHTYNALTFVIDTDGVEFESPFGLTGCSSRDFERALTFCANDRSCAEPPSPELARIIKETALPGAETPSVPPESKPTREASTSAIQKSLADLAISNDDDDDDEDDENYVPSESEESDSDEEVSDTDPTDIGTANIKAERDEYNAQQKEKQSSGQ